VTDAAFFAGLLPQLADLARAHRARCEAHGLKLVWISGFRSPAEQIANYAKGRKQNLDGSWSIVDDHQVVTRALPKDAPHCRRAAYDVAPVDQHERIDWNRLDLFQAVASHAPPGLIWGGSWPKLKDLDHFELPGWRFLPLPPTP
jgi:hypothetical protein